MLIQQTWILSFAILLSGCQFVPQAPIVVKPDLIEKRTDVGGGKVLRVAVTDDRTSKTLGTRAIRGIGTELTVTSDIADTLKASLSAGLTNQAFVAIDHMPNDGRSLDVSIRNVRYTVNGGIVAFVIKTECDLAAECVVGSARPYEKLYRGAHEVSVQHPDTAEANVEYVNDAISNAVNQLLDDSELAHCLAGPAR